MQDGSNYIGDFKDDKMHGKGELTFPNGSVYKGDFENGTSHGWGVFSYHDGAVYKGEFNNGIRNGEGVFKLENGDTTLDDYDYAKKLKELKGRFLRAPLIHDVPYPVAMEPNLVVEYYSRS